MNIIEALKFDLPYLAVAVGLVLLVGFPVMNRVLTPGISLRDALFEKDNPVAGLETGGFLMALLYVSYSAISGPSLASFAHDVGAAALAVVMSIALVVVARTILSKAVAAFNGGDDLNHEIFTQHNWAAACVSLALMMGVVNGMTEENTLGPAPLEDAAIAVTVMLCALTVVLLYRFTHLRGASFFKEFFADDNPAAGVSLLGFAFAANYMLAGVAESIKAENLSLMEGVVWVAGLSLVLVILLGILRAVFMGAINLTQKTNMHDEIFEQNNTGAGFMDAALTIGSAILLVATFV